MIPGVIYFDERDIKIITHIYLETFCSYFVCQACHFDTFNFLQGILRVGTCFGENVSMLQGKIVIYILGENVSTLQGKIVTYSFGNVRCLKSS